MDFINKFNNYIAEKVSFLLCSMYFFYFCVLLVIIAIICPALVQTATFISGTIIQLWSLPILGVVSDLSTNKMIKLLQETHDTVMQSHDELHIKLDLIIKSLENK